MHELFIPDSEFHIEKNKLSQHLMILSVYISLRFAMKTKREKKKSSASVKCILDILRKLVFSS